MGVVVLVGYCRKFGFPLIGWFDGGFRCYVVVGGLRVC